jgi:fructose-1-phosphate kinase PfkB-like protein
MLNYLQQQKQIAIDTHNNALLRDINNQIYLIKQAQRKQAQKQQEVKQLDQIHANIENICINGGFKNEIL